MEQEANRIVGERDNPLWATPSGRRNSVMAHIDYKEGSYSIAASESKDFTFWWGRDSHAPNEYFNVSIAPQFDTQHPAMEPLVEQSRAIYHDPRPGVGVVLVLTLQNRNRFAVNFVANHVRIYA
jgi:hypothetical protein